MEKELFLLPTSAGDFPFPSPRVLEINSTTTVSQAFKLLVDNNILSLPVFDPSINSYIGWLDVLSLVTLILRLDSKVHTLKMEMLTSEVVLDIAKNNCVNNLGSETSIKDLFDAGEDFAPFYPWMPVSISDSMKTVLLKLKNRTKRVPVLDKKGRICKIISQNSIIQYLHNSITEQENSQGDLPSVLSKSVNQLGFLKTVVAVYEDEKVEEVLKIMRETKLSAVAIYDEDDELFTCLTSKDLLNFNSLEHVALDRLKYEQKVRSNSSDDHRKTYLQMSVGDFVSLIRQRNVTKKTKAAVITVSPTDSLRKVIGKLATCKIHRVFVIDQKKAVGVVSVKDVIATVFNA